jgi:hypothetical protein
VSIIRSDRETREAAKAAVANGEMPYYDIAVLYCHAKHIYFVKRYFTHVVDTDMSVEPNECVMCMGQQDHPCRSEEVLGVINNVRPSKSSEYWLLSWIEKLSLDDLESQKESLDEELSSSDGRQLSPRAFVYFQRAALERRIEELKRNG